MRGWARNFFKISKPLLGLDVSGASIKLCELRQHKQQYCVERCVLESLNSSTEQARVDALQTLIEKADIEGHQVALTMAGPSVFTRVLSIEKGLKETELQEQIELGLETWFPFPVEEVFYDFTLIDLNAREAKTQSLYIAVARREVVEAQRDWVESFGLKVAVVEVASLALERAFRLFLQPLDALSLNPMESHILLDISERNITLYIFHNHRFIYTQDIGLNINEYLAEEEVFKATLVDNIHRTLQRFSSEPDSPIPAINTLILSGEFPQLLGLDKILVNCHPNQATGCHLNQATSTLLT